MSHKSNYISIVQFDEHLIARLRVHRSAKGIEVIAHDVERGEWSTRDGSLEAALKAFAMTHKLAEDEVYTILPRHEMTARILELPSQDSAEVAGMVRLSCEEYVPYPAEELIIDQCILQKTSQGQSLVLAVFAHHDVVDNHVRLCQNAEIEPEQIYLSTACLASAVMASHDTKATRYALVNLASGGVEAIVMRGKRLEYGRAVASSQDWSLKAEFGDEAATAAVAEMEEELRLEVRASLSAYRRESEDGEGVDVIYFCSDWADVVNSSGSLANEFAEECLPAPFVNALTTQGADHLNGIPLTALGAALLAQNRGEVSIRLLPETILAARQTTGLKKRVYRYLSLAAGVLLALGMLYWQAVYQRESYIHELKSRISKIEPRAKGIASKQKQLTILQNQVERSRGVVELLAAMCDVFPESGLNITRFVFSHNERMELWGRAKSLQVVNKLTDDLRGIGKGTLTQFSRAQQAYTSKITERNQEVLDYKIIIPFGDAATPQVEDESN